MGQVKKINTFLRYCRSLLAYPLIKKRDKKLLINGTEFVDRFFSLLAASTFNVPESFCNWVISSPRSSGKTARSGVSRGFSPALYLH